MKAVVAAFNQEKALVGAFSVITNLWMDFFEALLLPHCSLSPCVCQVSARWSPCVRTRWQCTSPAASTTRSTSPATTPRGPASHPSAASQQVTTGKNLRVYCDVWNFALFPFTIFTNAKISIFMHAESPVTINCGYISHKAKMVRQPCTDWRLPAA